MKQYLNLMRDVLENGTWQENRTGIRCITLPGAMLKFDMADGFPAVTTKKLAFKSVVGELIGFLRGETNVKAFQELGCKVWDGNATADYWLNNPNNKGDGDLGRIYGAQWRAWYAGEDWNQNGYGQSLSVDQLANALHDVRNNPTSRRIIVNAWNPAELDQTALPPCHMLFQLIPHVNTGKLHMVMYQRSCDLFLGVPFNIASYATLLHLFSSWTGYTPGTLTMMLADVHIYENHLDQVTEQLSREPKHLPRLWIQRLPTEPLSKLQNLGLDDLLKDLKPSDFILQGYEHHEAISAPMAV
jgi:thymidylate synthase